MKVLVSTVIAFLQFSCMPEEIRSTFATRSITTGTTVTTLPMSALTGLTSKLGNDKKSPATDTRYTSTVTWSTLFSTQVQKSSMTSKQNLQMKASLRLQGETSETCEFRQLDRNQFSRPSHLYQLSYQEIFNMVGLKIEEPIHTKEGCHFCRVVSRLLLLICFR